MSVEHQHQLRQRRLFSIHGDAFEKHLPEGTVVFAFHGVEEVLQPYRYDIGLYVPNLDPHSSATILSHVHFHFADGGHGEDLRVHGIVADVQTLQRADNYTIFRVSIVPSLWLLSLAQHSRTFVGKTTKEILTKIFSNYDFGKDPKRIEFQLKSSASPKRQKLVCQFNETDLAFVSRLMEREGWYYYFEQHAHHEKLIITDESTGAPALFHSRAVRYEGPGSHRQSYAHGHSTAIRNFHGRLRALPELVRAKESDDSHHVEATHQDYAPTSGSVVVYGETDDEEKTQGDRLGLVRAEMFAATRHVYDGDGDVRGFKVGHVVMIDHADVNNDPRLTTKEGNYPYFVTRLEHWGHTAVGIRSKELTAARRTFFPNQEWSQATDDTGAVDGGAHKDELYSIQFMCVPAPKTTYRPPLRTPVPKANSVVLGTVPAPATPTGTGANKRYEVVLDFDEDHNKVLAPREQPAGSHFELRPDAKVLVKFRAGNVDQPYIAGVIPSKNDPIHDVPAGTNVIQGNADNRLVFDDNTQSLSASTREKNSLLTLGKAVFDNSNVAPVIQDTAGIGQTFNALLQTDGKAKFHFGDEWNVDSRNSLHSFSDTYSRTAGAHQYTVTAQAGTAGFLNETLETATRTVNGHVSEQHGSHALNIVEGSTMAVGQNHLMTVGGNHTVNVSGGHYSTTTGDHNIDALANHRARIGIDHTVEVTQHQTVTVGGNHTTTVSGGHFTTTSGPHNVDAMADHRVRVGNDHSVDVTNNYALTIGGVSNVTTGNHYVNVAQDHNLDVMGNYRVRVGGQTSIQGVQVSASNSQTDAQTVTSNSNTSMTSSNTNVISSDITIFT